MGSLEQAFVTKNETFIASKDRSGGFPLTFNLYWNKCHLYLGEHASQHQYSVALHSGFGSKPELVLHSGSDTNAPPLATAKTKSFLSNHTVVKIPGHNAQEQLRGHWSMKSSTYSFSIQVEDGTESLPEHFEWRQSRGEEVQALDKMAWGWKLVRLDTDAATERGGKRKDRDAGLTSEGKEIVAVWADNGKLSLNKTGKFQFLGSGASGELGECWAIMAVTSMLRIWQITYAATTAAAVS